MQTMTFNRNDMLTCIELASDGLTQGLELEEVSELIQRILYAIAESVQHRIEVPNNIEHSEQGHLKIPCQQYVIRVDRYYRGNPSTKD